MIFDVAALQSLSVVKKALISCNFEYYQFSLKPLANFQVVCFNVWVIAISGDIFFPLSNYFLQGVTLSSK